MNGFNMKQQVFYVHGGDSFLNYDEFLEELRTVGLWHMPKEGETEVLKKWTSRLAEDLGNEYQIISPEMPNKQNAKFQEWSIWFERHFEHLHDGVILIGYSLGAMFLAKYLSQNNLPFRPKAVFLLAGAYLLPNSEDKQDYEFRADLQKVRLLLDKTDNLFIYHSKDDFVVPYENGVALSQVIPEAQFVSFEDKNHFLIEEFPELLDRVRDFKDSSLS